MLLSPVVNCLYHPNGNSNNAIHHNAGKKKNAAFGIKCAASAIAAKLPINNAKKQQQQRQRQRRVWHARVRLLLVGLMLASPFVCALLVLNMRMGNLEREMRALEQQIDEMMESARIESEATTTEMMGTAAVAAVDDAALSPPSLLLAKDGAANNDELLRDHHPHLKLESPPPPTSPLSPLFVNFDAWKKNMVENIDQQPQQQQHHSMPSQNHSPFVGAVPPEKDEDDTQQLSIVRLIFVNDAAEEQQQQRVPRSAEKADATSREHLGNMQHIMNSFYGNAEQHKQKTIVPIHRTVEAARLSLFAVIAIALCLLLCVGIVAYLLHHFCYVRHSGYSSGQRASLLDDKTVWILEPLRAANAI